MNFSRIVAVTGEGIVAPPEILKNLSKRARKKRSHKYTEAIEYIKKKALELEPSDMHKALAEYNVPVVTMEINKLHQKAGNTNVIELNGNVLDDSLVLFGDQLINYFEAWNLMDTLEPLYGEKTALLTIGVDEKNSTIKDFIIESIRHNVFVERIKKGEEYKVRSFLAENLMK